MVARGTVVYRAQAKAALQKLRDEQEPTSPQGARDPSCELLDVDETRTPVADHGSCDRAWEVGEEIGMHPLDDIE
jgi:hypothetical protein